MISEKYQKETPLHDVSFFGAGKPRLRIAAVAPRDLARLLLPQIIRMYESEEGKKQLEEWKAEQEKQKEIAAAESKSEGS